MGRVITVLLGPNEEDNTAALKLLDILKDEKLFIVGDCAGLSKYVLMPYIATRDQGRFYGVDSIRDFVEAPSPTPDRPA